MDIATAITIFGGEQLAVKLLGPSCEYIGNNLKLLTEKMHNNLAAVFKKAEQKLGGSIDASGAVPPRVLKSILENGAWCEEELQAEYFGGVLASSRNENCRDDRGAYYTDIIASLTSYQLRLHYLIYMEVRRLFAGNSFNIGEPADRMKLELFIPYETYLISMDFSESEIKNYHTLMQHSVWGLSNSNLIESFKYGFKESFVNELPGIGRITDMGGIMLKPSQLGAEVFLWAYGYGQKPANSIFDASVSFTEMDGIIVGNASAVKEIKNR